MNELQGFGFVVPHWAYWGWLAIMPLTYMYWLNRKESKKKAEPTTPDEELALDILAEEDPVLHTEGNRLTRIIDKISDYSGVFIALWTVNAVVAYFYEVVMRYVFNMPTIWVHEASFLLFGMQYLMTGAYALLHGAHVRVDILYVKLPPRGRVGMDIFTSVFFFIFAIALMGTSWVFFTSSYGMNETTLETWGIQYWPVKLLMFTGAVLITLAGLSKLIKDIMLFRLMGEGNKQ
ncbi:TRAP transporter small permease subunit [Sulfuriflexus mobilis]|uniref:TRAP transporter small permease subunit n=1 Tax=Sulfuriflexus mobilis TaxID=1811807 RepID=UPI000F82D9CB|nr:TRAP transporter small permease subunit [Sulfuriflexus mobilis]